MTSEPEVHPFTRRDADIVLRSSDDVDFRVHKIILSLASPILEGMLSIPQPPTPSVDDPDTTDDGKPIIHMRGEDSEMLEAVLRECYPGMESKAQKDLRIVGKVLAMAEKYEMEGIIGRMEIILQYACFVQKEPLRVYAIARRYNLSCAARVAAKESLLHPAMPNDCPKEFEGMSAAAHYDLIAYREECAGVLDRTLHHWRRGVWKDPFIQVPSWSTCGNQYAPTARISQLSGCPRLSGNNYLLMPMHQVDMYKDCSLWFVDHIERVKTAFKAKITGNTVASLPLLKETVAAIRAADLTCPCGISGSYHLLIFSQALVEQIDRKLDEVCGGDDTPCELS